VIPPGFDLSISALAFCICWSLEPRGLRLPIDLFRSPARSKEQHWRRSLGHASDGTLGLRAIKEQVGAAFVYNLLLQPNLMECPQCYQCRPQPTYGVVDQLFRTHHGHLRHIAAIDEPHQVYGLIRAVEKSCSCCAPRQISRFTKVHTAALSGA
jgi:hypothetical protein